jgi:hypothetical protein
MWINIVLDTKESMAVILGLFSYAIAYLKHRQAINSSYAKTPNLSGAEVEQLKAAAAILVKAKREELLAEITPRDAEPEYRNRLSVAADRMCELTERGARVLPALSAPPEIKQDFLKIVQQIHAKPVPKQLPTGPEPETEPAADSTPKPDDNA